MCHVTYIPELATAFAVNGNLRRSSQTTFQTPQYLAIKEGVDVDGPVETLNSDLVE
ncbi:hypothetical protein J6590_034173 [Homalodisca vitripennis]|nr:hypothetical protein J6590_034173 [Homalodisca vitripennis]